MASYRKESTASLRGVSRIIAWAEGAARKDPDLTNASINAMLVCIQELVSNVAFHAKHCEGTPTVRLLLQIEAGGIVVCIEDNGQPFDPMMEVPRRVDTDLASADLGGRGLLIVRQMSRAMSYVRVGEWNCVRLEIA